MARTIRRQPFSVSTDKSSHPNPSMFVQGEFKGIVYNDNAVNVDAQTFADANNVYIDDDGILVSRPPIKLYETTACIVDQFAIGSYILRLTRIPIYITTDDDGETVYNIAERPNEHNQDDLYFLFDISCASHNTISGTVNDMPVTAGCQWIIPVSSIGWEFIPAVTCAQIEDKIFIWFAGIDFVAFNTTGAMTTSGNRYLYFESGQKYLYYPIHKLVVNGIESELETKNFLTDVYRKRHIYSAVSSVNFEHLTGKIMRVGLTSEMTSDTSAHLYDIVMQEHQDKMLVYPYSSLGGNYHVDVVQTPRATVVMRYGTTTGVIEVSFDGKFFRPTPTLAGIVGLPLLTRDGLWVVAFTTKGLAKCKLAAQETIDFMNDSDVFTWVIEPYMRNALYNGFPCSTTAIDTTFMPSGYFETIDNFAYIFKTPSVTPGFSGNIEYLYTEWLNGANNTVWSHKLLVSPSPDGSLFTNMIPDAGAKIHFRYVAPTANHQDIGAAISILPDYLIEYNDNAELFRTDMVTLNYFFKQEDANIGRVLSNNDAVLITEMLGNVPQTNENTFSSRLHRVSSSGKEPIYDDAAIRSNDVVLDVRDIPLDASDAKQYSADVSYNVGDLVHNSKNVLFRCRRATKGNGPPEDAVDGAWSGNDYWQLLAHPYTANTVALKNPYLFLDVIENNETVQCYAAVTWKVLHLLMGGRYRIEKIDGSFTTIAQMDRVHLSALDVSVHYSADELERLFGGLTLRKVADDSVFRYDGWDVIGSVTINTSAADYTGHTIILGLNDTANINKSLPISLAAPVTVGGATYTMRSFYSPCADIDVQILAPTISSESIVYDIIFAYNTVAANDTGTIVLGCIMSVSFDSVKNTASAKVSVDTKMARRFKIAQNERNVLTDKYSFIDGEYISLPDNGKLNAFVPSTERENLKNNDTAVLITSASNGTASGYMGSVHKVNSKFDETVSGIIESGNLIAFTLNADGISANDYLTPLFSLAEDGSLVGRSPFYYAETVTLNSSGSVIGVKGGELKIGTIVRFRAYDKDITLPIGHPGNPYTDKSYTLKPWTYPAAPADWTVGNEWPWNNIPVPMLVESDGLVRSWTAGDALPTGSVIITGSLNVIRRIQPICMNTSGVWYSIDGNLWTSSLSSESILELDEYINVTTKSTLDDNGNIVSKTMVGSINTAVPTAHAVMNEHYLSYEYKGKYLLEVTQMKKDEDKLLTDRGTDRLLYLPERNEQSFSNAITALHPLSDTEIGIFTKDEVWYVSSTVLSDGTVAYTRPIKSKIPVGLRKGDEVVTLLDGQALVFPTVRGLVALAPQDFIATTEKTLTYLSDAILPEYLKFYSDYVENATTISYGEDIKYYPFVKLKVYRHWLLMYKYYDRTIFAFDTRSGSWWKWTTPYPIKSMMTTSRLYLLMQVDFSPISQPYAVVTPPDKIPYLGLNFIFADKEIESLSYIDDVLVDTINGEISYVDETIDIRRIIHKASPIIDWHISSQNLHFGQINNYKDIKGIVLNVGGDKPVNIKLHTKAYRDLQHPIYSECIEANVAEFRNIVKRLNVMRVTDFKYQLENDASVSNPHQFKLNSLSIKYETKGGIR